MKKLFTLIVAFAVTLGSMGSSTPCAANSNRATYTVTLSTNMPNLGELTGSGTYNEGETVTITATPASGYTFVGWTEGTSMLSTQSTFSFEINSNRSIVGNFMVGTAPQNYEISLTANPVEGGTVSGGGTYANGTSISILATANDGYSFVNWTENGSEVSSNSSYSFEVNSNRNLQANFDLNSVTYTVTVEASPEGGGQVTGGGTYNDGEEVTVTATPNTGYSFVHWTESGVEVSTSATYTFTASANHVLIAVFEQMGYNITAAANPTEGGTITGTGFYADGATATLVAVPNSGYIFSAWFEASTTVSEEATYEFTVTGDRNLVANFDEDTSIYYNIDAVANPTAGGTVTGAGTYIEGETATLLATANQGYTFISWTEGGTTVSEQANYQFEVTDDRTLVANFEEIPATSYTIQTSSNPTEGGTTTGGGTYDEGSTVTVVATANEGYEFISWTEDGTTVSSEASYEFTATSNRTLVANFEEIPATSYTIQTSSNPTEGGTTTGGGTYGEGSTVTVVATANVGFEFTSWTEGETTVSSEASYEFTATSNRTLVANFEEIPATSYTIQTSSSPTEGGTTTGGGTYDEGSAVTVVATANEGYEFISWTEDGTTVSSEASYEFTATSNRTLVANFVEVGTPTFTVSATANPVEGGTISGAGVYNQGQTATLVATANEGYAFVSWTADDVEVSNESTYSFAVESDVALVANFNQIPLTNFTITSIANPVEGGTTTGGGIYAQGDSVTVEATPNANYAFVAWVSDSTTISTESVYTFVANQDIELVAQFVATGFSIEVEVNNLQAGTVTGGGIYAVDSTATLVATTNEGYSFIGWAENDSIISTDTLYSFVVTCNRTLVATFEANAYQIIATATEGGQVIGAGSYNHNEVAILTTTADSSYIFLNWTEDSVEISYESTYRFLVTGPRTLVANFGLAADYPLGSRYNPLLINSLEEFCQVRDIVNAGAGSFKEVNISNGASDKFFKLTCNIDLSTVCGDTTNSWTPIGTQINPFRGNLDGNNKQIDNLYINEPASDCQGLFGQIISSEIRNLILNNATVIARSNVGGICGYAHSAAIIERCAANGWIEGLGSSVGGICGYALSSCTISGCSNSCLVSGVGSQVGGICGYAVLNSNILTCANYGPISGQSSYIGGICGFAALTSSITSSLNTGTITGSWYRGSICGLNYLSTTSSCYYDMQMSIFKGVNNKDIEGVSAGLLTTEIAQLIPLALVGENWTENRWVFEQNRYPVIAGFEANELVKASASPIFLNVEEKSAAIESTLQTATEQDAVWSSKLNKVVFAENKGHLVSLGADTLVVAMQGVIAKYVPIAITNIDSIAIEATAQFGTISGTGNYLFGQTVELVATPNTGYSFTNWTQNGDTVATTSTYTFSADTNRSFVVNFAPNMCNILATVNEGGFVEGAGSYPFDSRVTLVATADSAHAFVNWTIDGQIVSTNRAYSFVVNGDCSLVANFNRNVYQITGSPANIAQGSVSGSGLVAHGQIAHLVANSYYGYQFDNWTEDGQSVSTQSEYSFAVLGARQLVANFIRSQYQVLIVNSEGHSPIEGGTVTGNGVYSHGDSVLLTATPDIDYEFLGWVEGRDTLSKQTYYKFRIVEPRTIRACFQSTTGIDDIPFELSLYPNPASQMFIVKHSGATEIKIFDVVGKLVYVNSLPFGETQTTIYCDNYQSGVYLVHLTNAKGQIRVQRVVIQR